MNTITTELTMKSFFKHYKVLYTLPWVYLFFRDEQTRQDITDFLAKYAMPEKNSDGDTIFTINDIHYLLAIE